MGWFGTRSEPVAKGCVRCRSRKTNLAQCPFCGTPASELVEQAPAESSLAQFDRAVEKHLRTWAVPAVFAVAILVAQSDMLHGLARTFMTMWLHELGHAIAGWMTGYGAVPGPWRTLVSDERMILVTIAIVVALGALAYRALSDDRRILAGGLAAGAVLAIAGATLVAPHDARMLFTFAGDAGMMLIGAALVLTFWASPGSHLHESWLRWGFVVIGAFALVDGMGTWWIARGDPSAIPYGEIEGVGLSDPSKLTDVHGWSQGDMIRRFSNVGLVACAICAGRYLAGLWQIYGRPRA